MVSTRKTPTVLFGHFNMELPPSSNYTVAGTQPALVSLALAYIYNSLSGPLASCGFLGAN